MFKYKAIRALTWTGLEGSRKWILPDLKKIET
jgi:hypothetical protein